ncbi:MAG TPA: HGGxSTG domain-containing protein [Vicinamibacterales bacterium]|nr:HGGxSTG domain-containing protein [Vicinamibacterales bacterium]
MVTDLTTTTDRQCTATNRAGQPCRRKPIRGGTVCIMHGGLAPQTLAAAKLKLMAGRDLAIDALINALGSHGPICEACGRSDSDRDPAVIRAAQIVLDRTGFGPSATLVVEPAASNEFAGLSTDQLIAHLEQMLASVRAAHPIIDAQVDATDVQDGVCIDSDDMEDGELRNG